ncbi:MAG: DNA gyrase inhibitor YacG [Bryobacterales bacterium]|jgi:hypothetical protein|nr:DNA gyrase inhibitor YacG [Bryobacterales bacterium]
MTSTKTIPCPICKTPVALTSKELPFCSERCRLIDLGLWADEAYRISEPLKDLDAEDRAGHESQ